jgi:hypothetical protein
MIAITRDYVQKQNLANKLKNLHVTTMNAKCPAELFVGVKPKLSPEFWIEFGRQGFVTDRKKIKRKDKQRGIPMIMVGYADNHSPEMYRMYNAVTGTVVMSLDAKWAKWDHQTPQKH